MRERPAYPIVALKQSAAQWEEGGVLVEQALHSELLVDELLQPFALAGGGHKLDHSVRA